MRNLFEVDLRTVRQNLTPELIQEIENYIANAETVEELDRIFPLVVWTEIERLIELLHSREDEIRNFYNI
jgi:hypothetical protein